MIKLAVGLFKLLKEDILKSTFNDGQDALIRLCENVSLKKLIKATNFSINYVDLVGDSGLEVAELFGMGLPTKDEGQVVSERKFWLVIGKLINHKK